MSFCQPCFIRKNTPELRKKLEKLGYKLNPYNCDDNPIIDVSIGGLITFIDEDDIIENVEYGYVDCGTNEELFLALAALRDDTPINSYYWFNNKLVMCYSVFDLNANQSITYRFMPIDNPKICFPANIDIMRKATVEEIVKHFKDK